MRQAVKRIERFPAALVAAFAAFACAGLSGCTNFQSPKWDVYGRTLAAVPFADRTAPKGQSWYTFSPRGQAIVRGLKAWVEKHWDENLEDGHEIDAFLKRVEEWEEPAVKWGDLVTGLPADLVLVGDITGFRTRQAEQLNIFQGSADVAYSIWDCQTGRRLYSGRIEDIRYPVQGETDIPLSAVSATDFQNREKEIERGLARVIAERIGKDLWGYYED